MKCASAATKNAYIRARARQRSWLTSHPSEVDIKVDIKLSMRCSSHQQRRRVVSQCKRQPLAAVRAQAAAAARSHWISPQQQQPAHCGALLLWAHWRHCCCGALPLPHPNLHCCVQRVSLGAVLADIWEAGWLLSGTESVTQSTEPPLHRFGLIYGRSWVVGV